MKTAERGVMEPGEARRMMDLAGKSASFWITSKEADAVLELLATFGVDVAGLVSDGAPLWLEPIVLTISRQATSGVDTSDQT